MCVVIVVGFAVANATREGAGRTRRKHRQILLDEAGGRCVECGYDRCPWALQFHHLDPSTKEFGIGGKGQTFSLERLRKEAAKCVLLCANCHVEVEHGTRILS